MQPYFFPYLGYFQLINAVDRFVLYDNIQFTKKGWIHRNRILFNGVESLFSINIKKASDYLDIYEREISAAYIKERQKFLRKIEISYKKSPYYKEVIPVIRDIILNDSNNLFEYILNSIKKLNDYMGITTPIIISSSVDVDKSLSGKNRVLATCLSLNCSEYINPIGGVTLYSKDFFLDKGVKLSFIEMEEVHYSQAGNTFISNLSIIDVLMWNSKSKVLKYLSNYKVK